MIMPEYELLLTCSRTRLTKSQSDRVRYLINKGNINWKSLFELASHHRTTPLVYKSLEYCPDLDSIAYLAKIKASYQRNCAKNLLFLGTLLQILNLLEKHDIQVIPFKGPILTDLIYGDLSLRSFVDLDILVSKSDLTKAIEILLQNGYGPIHDMPLQTYLRLIDKRHHATLRNVRNGVLVELHWELTGHYTRSEMNLAYIFPRLEKALIQNQIVMAIGQEDLLVYLCIHGNRHQWQELDAVCCIAELIQKRPDINWDLTFQIAREIGAVNMLVLAGILVQRLLGLDMPVLMNDFIGSRAGLSNIAENIENNMINPREKTVSKSFWISYVHFHTHTLDGLSDGIRYMVRKVYEPYLADVKWLPLPYPLWFLYAVIRPLRFFVEYSKKLLKRVF